MKVHRKIVVKYINGHNDSSRDDIAKYEAIRKAFLQILSDVYPGFTMNEILKKIKSILPESIWPGGEKAKWWVKTVQLDLEIKKLIRRANTKPLRWYRI